MEAIEGFRKRLEGHFIGLTSSQKRIASYLLGNHDEAAFLPASALAGRLKVSEATVVRFARAVGYDGFPELRRHLQELFRLKVNPATRLQRKMEDLQSDQRHILQKVVEMEVQYLGEALQGIPPEEFDAAAKTIQGGSRVFVFGMGPSRVLADLVRIRLQRFGVTTIGLTESGRDLLENLLLLRRGDVVLAMGFLRATGELVAVLDHARSTGCKTVFLTDTLGLAFRGKADVILSARRGPVSSFHSLTVPMTILNALMLAVAVARPKQSLESINRLLELRVAYGLDVMGPSDNNTKRPKGKPVPKGVRRARGRRGKRK